MKKPTIICLMGPTAAGKTRLAIELAQRLNGEIISVDSAIVYREMDIGTAKPSREERLAIPHYLIDICDPAHAYSAGQFRRDALEKIETILKQERMPILVGGTMLYFHVLQHGLSELPSANAEIRAQLAEAAQEKSWEALHAQLKQIDPIAAERISPNDQQRISRALEIFQLTGKSLSEIIQKEKMELLPYQMINLAIAPADRVVLHERIARRFQVMLQQGFIAEVEHLFRRGDLTPDMPSMRAVGYRQMWDYLAGAIAYPEMQERAIIATRQLAKRQLTWLRSWTDLHWFDSESPNVSDQIVHNFFRVNP